jgi:hypothetical protein
MALHTDWQPKQQSAAPQIQQRAVIRIGGRAGRSETIAGASVMHVHPEGVKMTVGRIKPEKAAVPDYTDYARLNKESLMGSDNHV